MSLFKTETRIQLVGVVFLTGIAAIVGKLWFLQVVHGQFWKDKIRTNGQVTVRIPSVRGEIRDRNGLPMVTNRASHEVNFYLSEMVRGYKQLMGAKHVPTRDYQTTVKGTLQTRKEVDINQIVRETVIPRFEDLDLEDEYNASTLQLHYRNDTLVPFTFMEDIDFEDMAKLSEHDVGLPGVRIADRPVRQYVYDSLAAHVLGYVGPVDTDRKDIKEDARKFDFYQADVEGKNNVEASMDKYLRGKPGISYVQRNAKGVIEDEVGVTPPTPGANVYLTIDARIQSIAENAMRQVGRGAAVVVDPNNGDILAMVSVPSFNPNSFIPSISGKNWNALIKDETNPLTNRAILGYAPGSTFKTVTALAGLRKGIGKNRYTCTGGVTYGNKYMKCWIAEKGGSHGNLTLEEALKYSCNAYFYQYGNAAGIDQIDEVAEMVGLGQTPDLGLSNEAAGVIPGPEWLAQHQPKDRWSQGYTANTSIGQGLVLCSPVQMALEVATVANGGICYHGRLIDKVVENDGTPEAKVILQEPPQVRTNLVEEGLKAEDIEHVRRGMWRVVNDSGGTASKAKLKGGIEVAGKTGTAQFWRNGQKDNHTWFICFAPYDKPKYAICVFLQGAKSGGGTAAPIAARILEESFALEKGYKPEVKPLPPALGNFNFVENITFDSAGPDAYATPDATPKPGDPVKKDPANGGDEEEDAHNDDDTEDAAAKKNTDADHQEEVPQPAVRAEPDAGSRPARRKRDPDSSNTAAAPRVRTAQPVAASADAPSPGANGSAESPFGRSMRKFFHRDAGTDEVNDDNVRRQQRTIRSQRDQQQQASNGGRRNSPPPQTNPPAAQPPPKRKKLFGIF